MTQTLTVPQVAALLGCSRAAIYLRIQHGTIPVEHTVAGYRIPAAAFQRWRKWQITRQLGLPPRPGEYTLRQAAKKLGIAYSTLHYHVQRGKYPARREGHLWRIQLEKEDTGNAV